METALQYRHHTLVNSDDIDIQVYLKMVRSVAQIISNKYLQYKWREVYEI